MKKIDRTFAMKVLEKIEGKPAKQIEEEAALYGDAWPHGKEELESCLWGHVNYARIAIEYFHENRPSVITREDVEEIFRRTSRKQNFKLMDVEVDRRIRDINFVFDVYENTKGEES